MSHTDTPKDPTLSIARQRSGDAKTRFLLVPKWYTRPPCYTSENRLLLCHSSM